MNNTPLLIIQMLTALIVTDASASIDSNKAERAKSPSLVTWKSAIIPVERRWGWATELRTKGLHEARQFEAGKVTVLARCLGCHEDVGHDGADIKDECNPE
jgi:hypothetical protein